MYGLVNKNKSFFEFIQYIKRWVKIKTVKINMFLSINPMTVIT